MNLRLVTNFILFQLGWFACVIGAASDIPWSGTFLVMAILGYHLYSANDAETELRLLALVLLIGFIWDSLLVAFGILEYSSGLFHASLAPHWIIAMWALFSSTLNVSMNWLKGHYLVAGIFGAIGGPLAYYAGLKLGAVSMPSTTVALGVLAIGWALIMPALVYLSQRFNGFEPISAVKPSNRELFDV